MTATKTIPAYRPRKGYSQAIVTLTDALTGKRKDYWLGDHGTTASYEIDHRVLADWESRGRRLPPPKKSIEKVERGLTIEQLIAAYKTFVEKTYKRPSQQTIFMVLGVLSR